MTMKLMRTRSVWAVGLVVGVLSLLTATAQATVVTSGCANVDASCTMDELFNGGTITVNDKLFSGWALEASFSEPDFFLIEVSGLDDGGADPHRRRERPGYLALLAGYFPPVSSLTRLRVG